MPVDNLKQVVRFYVCKRQTLCFIILIIMHFPLYIHFDWLLAHGQFVILQNSDVTPADNSFLRHFYR